MRSQFQQFSRCVMEQEPVVFGMFWECLVQAGTLDEDLVKELKEAWHPDAWTPLGKILVDQGILTQVQVANLLALQADEPRMRLGDLAVREGLCSDEDVKRTLDHQRETCPGPIELLMQSGGVGTEELLGTLLTYVRFLEGLLLGKYGPRQSADQQRAS